MKRKDFSQRLQQVDALSAGQRQRLAARLSPTTGAPAVRRVVEARLADAPHCPHCGHDSVVRWGIAGGWQRYRCGACQATFNALTGTPLARLRRPAQWAT